MRKSVNAYLIATAVFLVTFIALVYFGLRVFPPSHTEEWPMAFIVDRVIGLGETSEQGDLFFGGIPPGSRGKRTITFTNFASSPRTIILRAFGDFAPWVEYSNNSFTLLPQENQTVLIAIRVPENATLGNYSGVLRAEYVAVR